MTDIAARPERTGRKASGPNLFLLGFGDDEVLEREELAAELDVTVRSVRSYQYLIDDPLPFLDHGGKIRFRAGSVREWMRRRETNRNKRGT